MIYISLWIWYDFYINDKYYAEALIIILFFIGIIIGDKYLFDFIAFLSALLN
jgi:hypothetical protein